MSKIGAYLQEHISGEVSLSRDVREKASRDASFLKLKPEMVIYPKNTNDIRKIARFSWQLAERGHTLPITARGLGNDETGAAIGSGIILSLPAFMNKVFEYEPKQRLTRLQPGVTLASLNNALGLHDARIPALPNSDTFTVGGAIANNARGVLSGKYGSIGDWVDRVEVVLANGEIIQTGRISKKELNQKKGLGTLEGEIYRGIDSLIEDNPELIAALEQRSIGTNAGYCSISQVKKKDGSFDLTPLIIGSQGTLGIISEVILRAAPRDHGMTAIVAAFKEEDATRDIADEIIAKLQPAIVESFDAALFEKAVMLGKSYSFLSEAGFDVKTVLVIAFDDISGRARKHSLKKTEKLLTAVEAWYEIAEDGKVEDILSIRNALLWTASPDKLEFSPASIFGGAYIPPEGLSVFQSGIKTIAKKHSVDMPMYGQNLQSLYYIVPAFNLKKSGEKQKIFKIFDEYARLVQKVNGEVIGTDGEGRFRSRFVLGTFDDDTLKLFTDIKKTFDPHKMLNPGVKEMMELKQLVPLIENDAFFPSLPNHIPYI